MPAMGSRDGQAAADYAAVLLVVATVLALAGAVAMPGVGERVLAAVRTGVCIVGGDICRDAEARAAGLAPCVTSERESGTATTLDVLSLRVGEDGRWTVSLRSDGSAVVTRAEGKELGATGGFGYTVKHGGRDTGIEAGLAWHAGLVRESASSWTFPDVGAARRFLERALGPDPRGIASIPAEERWHAGGEATDASIGAEVPWLGSAGGRAGTEALLGRRTGGGRTTWFFRGTLDDPQVYATLPAWSTSGPAREAVLEYTTERGQPRELVVRSSRATSGRVEEVTARLDLRDPEIRARIGDGAPWPPAVVREIAGLAATRGVVERQVHVVDDRSDTYALGGKVGLALGVEHARIDVRSRLADAAVWIAGAGPRRREDCLIPPP